MIPYDSRHPEPIEKSYLIEHVVNNMYTWDTQEFHEEEDENLAYVNSIVGERVEMITQTWENEERSY